MTLSIMTLSDIRQNDTQLNNSMALRSVNGLHRTVLFLMSADFIEMLNAVMLIMSSVIMVSVVPYFCNIENHAEFSPYRITLSQIL